MIKKILIIRFSSLGDTLLCTPIARCLKEKGGYEVHFLTKKASVPLLEGNPHIDHIHVFNDSLKECILDLQKEKFDFVVDLHKNLRSFCVRAALHKLWKQVGTYPKLSVARFARIHLHCKKAMPPTHVVDRYFKAIQSLGIQNDGKGLELFNLQKPISIEIPQLPFVAIAVGSKHFTKQIPLDRFIELCQNIHAPIVLLGDQTDANKAQAVLAHCPSVINACGKLSLAQTAYTIQAARLLISGDSALMHIASALNQNLISIWGSTVPDFGMYPYYPSTSKAIHLLFENLNINCRPCHKHGYPACPKKHFSCMENIDYKQITTEVTHILSF